MADYVHSEEIMIPGALLGFQKNYYYVQDMAGVLCASALVKLGCKRIHHISKLTIFVSAVNGASFLLIAKSVHMLYASIKASERSSAKKTILVALFAAIAAGTFKKRYSMVREPFTFGKPFVLTTAAIVLLSEGGVRAVQWISQNWGGIVDKCFPEPNIVPPPPKPPRPIAKLPEEMQPMKWDPEKIIASFRAGDEEEVFTDNMKILLRATECQLERPSEFPTEFCRVLREMKEIVPELSIWIKLVYCEIQKEAVEEGFYERTNISAQGIYDAIIWSMMHDTLNALPEGNEEQLQCLVDLVPIHIKDNREFNRTRTKVWFVLNKIQGVDLMLGLELSRLDDKIRVASGAAYLESSECDLGLLRRAAKGLLVK